MPAHSASRTAMPFAVRTAAKTSASPPVKNGFTPRASRGFFSKMEPQWSPLSEIATSAQFAKVAICRHFLHRGDRI
jgi:hypothetical protein